MSTIRWIIVGTFIIFCVAIVVVVPLLALSGAGGWYPDENSVYAKRVRAVDARLRVGMTRSQVMRLCKADIAMHPDDTLREAGGSYWVNEPTWPTETDFDVFEPRPYFWASFDTVRTIRMHFNDHDRLDVLDLVISRTGGP